MPKVVALPCECGREMRATDPRPGDFLRCIYCGARKTYEPGGPAASPAGSASITDAGFEGFDTGPMVCKKCGGELKVRYSGPRKTDRIAVCLYCKTKIDLPEVRGMTSEEVIRRPGEHIVKKVTRWEEVSGSSVEFDPVEMDLDPDLFDDGEGTGIEVSDGSGEMEFDNLDDFRKYIKEKVPPDQAEKILKMIPPDEFTGSSTITKTESVTIHSVEDDDGILSRIKGLFKGKK